jgi:YD repeat-containing protein
MRQHRRAGGNAVAPKRIDLAYSTISRFTGITRYNDLAGTEAVVSTSYGYDPLGRLTDLTHSQGATTLADYGWTYDAASRVTQMTSLADGASNYGAGRTGHPTFGQFSSGCMSSATYGSIRCNTSVAGFAAPSDEPAH